MCDFRIGPQERDERGSEVRISLRKLECQRGEDELESTAVLNASQTEEGRSQTVVSEQPFRDGLRDRGLSRPSKPIEPEDGKVFEILGPVPDLAQHVLPGSVKTTFPVPVSISCSMRATTIIQNQRLGFETSKSAFLNFRLKRV